VKRERPPRHLRRRRGWLLQGKSNVLIWGPYRGRRKPYQRRLL